MKTATFIEKVRKMRENQKVYFRTRQAYYKDESIRLEKEVDAELARREPGLFDDGRDEKMRRQTLFWLKAKRGQLAQEGQKTDMIDAVIEWNEEQLKAEER